ncbi:PAS domain S-box-containing protein [Hoeflea marina]|uniref:histidine kinase n=1 Tax=Hoeflea marina TaxID=274592 RepID=A0A317PD37_9HYPH|nr:PAS domain-containing protein [Hoeflea marina]PWV97241.1 PAS domain S-box-containing protein [Hoeflea marina]
MLRKAMLSGVDILQVFNAAPNPYVILDRDLVIVGLNSAYEAVTMRNHDEVIGRNMFDAFPSDPVSDAGRLLRNSLARVLETGAPDNLPLIPYPIARPDGTMEDRFWSATHTPLFGPEGRVEFVLQHTVDVTELHLLRQNSAGSSLHIQSDVLRRADAVVIENAALGKESGHLRDLFERAPSFMAVLTGPEHVFSVTNAAFRQLIGQRDVLGSSVRDALPEISGQGFIELLDQVYRSGESYRDSGAKVSFKRKSAAQAEERYVDFIFQPLADSSANVTGILVQGYDVTDQKRAEEAARESESRFRSLAQSMPNHAWTALADGSLDWFNARVYEYSGLGEAELAGTGWARMVHEDDVGDVGKAWQAAVAAGDEYQTEFRLRRHDGQYRWHIARAVPVRDDAGEVIRWVGSNTDIEDQKQTEAWLADLNEVLEARVDERTRELVRTQDVLRQSQKMEAIGTLAGGIAHDFNNLLQVISGNLQMLARDVAGNEEIQARIGNALGGVTRGARLAQQLLAFSRRQPLAPKVINVGRLIRDMDEIMRRSLGEAVEIETVIGGGLWNTLADPGNVENALLNLAINARDAMDGRGKLTIEAGNAFLDDDYSRLHDEVVPGQYVMIAVSDTGTGMSSDIIAKVFEPFFTTKTEGKGTGLGLSMVYGFVKQSGGHIKIYSEPGLGTSIKIYLPRALREEDRVEAAQHGTPRGRGETVLVAEDDDAVRQTAVALLTDLGYRVLTAENARKALDVIETGVPIDLLFTDVVMPGSMKSTELAREAARQRPGMAILFTSGYTENSIVHEGRLDSGVHLLSKPYTSDAMARKVRQVLEKAAADTAAAEAAIAASPQPGTAAVPATAAGLVVLLCEDDILIRMSTSDMLADMGMTVVEAGSGAEALQAILANPIDVLVTDVGLPDFSGLELALRLRETLPDLPVIFATGHTEVPGSEMLGRTKILTKPYVESMIDACLRELGLIAAAQG